jgi:hypothetical protein
MFQMVELYDQIPFQDPGFAENPERRAPARMPDCGNRTDYLDGVVKQSSNGISNARHSEAL